MPEHQDNGRTVICSVVFVDIIEFSQRPVSLQMETKNILNRLIREAIVEVNREDHIVLDTGDGAALCFLASPEEALFFANSLLVALLKEKSTKEMALRIGINLGSVKLVKDIHGQRNILGDGINIAQRVMSFAQPNQILVSRSYFDVVSNLSPEYARLFRYLGVRQDKHVREHVVYEVTLGPSQQGSPSPPAQDITQRLVSETTAKPARVEAITGPIQQPASTPAKPFDEQWLAEVKQELTREIGPIASVIVHKCAKRVTSCADLIAAIERELGYEQGNSTFRSRIRLPEQPQATPQSEAVAADHNKAASGIKLNEQQLQILEKELIHYLGPVASVLIRRMAKHCKTYSELCQALALHIEDQAVRERILSNLLKG